MQISSVQAIGINLKSLPLGAVVQIQGTDTFVCTNDKCTATSTTVPPYKFIKMQARSKTGAVITNPNDINATYWVLADNYCWWGSSNCKSRDGIRYAYGHSWNADSTTSTNNLSVPQTNNVLSVLSNFYNNLPDIIDDLSKDSAIIAHPYDMFFVTSTSGTNTTSAGGCAANWANTNYIVDNNSFDFSNSATCTMTAKVGLLSYTEWQGSLAAYGSYTTPLGSGFSFCQVRYGAACNAAGIDAYSGDPVTATNKFSRITAFNPYYPWFRSPVSNRTDRVWRVNTDSSTYSVYYNYTHDTLGILPSIWLSSLISTDGTGGVGTYTNPYQIQVSEPNTTPIISIPTSPADNPWRSGVAGFTDIIVAGSVTDPDDQNLTIQYQIDEMETVGWQTLAVLDETTRTYSVPLNVANQTQGDHTLYLRAFDGIADSEIVSVTFRIDKVAPTISATGAGATWGNTQKSAVVTYSDPPASGGSGQSGILRAQYAWGTSASDPANLLGTTCTGGSAIGESGSSIQTPTTGGAHVLYLCAIDNAGNLTTNQGNYYWENTSPTVAQIPSVPVPESGIYTESPIITIIGTDPGTLGVNSSGIANVRYAWDTSFNSTDFPLAQGGLAPNWSANNTTTSIPENGTHTLYYQSRDNAGNVSGVQSVIYNLDTEAPTLETEILTTPEQIGRDGWYLSSPTVEISAHDYFGGVQDDSRIVKIVTDIKLGEVDKTYVDFNSQNNLISHPSETAQTTNYTAGDSSTPRTVEVSIPANGVYTVYYYSTNSTPLNSPIGYLTIQADAQAPQGTLTTFNPLTIVKKQRSIAFTTPEPAKDQPDNQLNLTYTVSDDYFDPTLTSDQCNQLNGNSQTSSGCNIPSNFTSGLLNCDLQESIAILNADGSTGDFSDFTTILSDCGTPEATNSATSTLYTNTYSKELESGRLYRYQLNLTDAAGNSNQIFLTDANTGLPTEGVVSNHLPILNISNLYQNQSAFPNTYISITGTISDLDLTDTLTVSAEIGGTTKSQVFIPNTTDPTSPGFNTPLSNQGFTLSWLGSEIVEGIYGVSTDPDLPSTSPIIISLTDGTNEVTQTYQGRIISRPTPEQAVTNDEIKDLYNSVYTKEAGALFFLAGTKPNLKDRTTGNFTQENPAANDFYCYSDTNCFNLKPNTLDPEGNTTSTSTQIWYKDIPNSTTGQNQTYPFIIQFYDQPLDETELRVLDSKN